MDPSRTHRRWGTALVFALSPALAPATSARADSAISPVIPDVPPRSGPPVSGPSGFRASNDLDDFYLWLGPTGDAIHAVGVWDTAFGGDLAALRVREHATVGAVGARLGFETFSAHAGGRVWLDAVVGTRVLGRTMVGVTAGPVLETASIIHARAGGEVGVWAFAGVTPFARVGVVQESGFFVELGVEVALPVFRR